MNDPKKIFRETMAKLSDEKLREIVESKEYRPEAIMIAAEELRKRTGNRTDGAPAFLQSETAGTMNNINEGKGKLVKCPWCEHNIPDTSRVCPYCSTEVFFKSGGGETRQDNNQGLPEDGKSSREAGFVHCPWCDRAMQEGSQFCPACGEEVKLDSANVTPAGAAGEILCLRCKSPVRLLGEYTFQCAEDNVFSRGFGLSSDDSLQARVFQCEKCGRLEFFAPD